MTEQERINAEAELERFRKADQIGRLYMKASVYRDADGSGGNGQLLPGAGSR